MAARWVRPPFVTEESLGVFELIAHVAHRDLVLLHYVAGFTDEEMARQRRSTASAIKQSRYRARKEIRLILEDDGLAPKAPAPMSKARTPTSKAKPRSTYVWAFEEDAADRRLLRGRSSQPSAAMATFVRGIPAERPWTLPESADHYDRGLPLLRVVGRLRELLSGSNVARSTVAFDRHLESL
jgi:hypothetical protein